MVMWNTTTSLCMRPFCFLVDKLLSCDDIRTPDFLIFFRNPESENSESTVSTRLIQASQFCPVLIHSQKLLVSDDQTWKNYIPGVTEFVCKKVRHELL